MSYQTQLRLANALLELIAHDGPLAKRQADEFRVRSGIVKHYDQDKKFGFIQMNEQSKEAFFHLSKVVETHRTEIGVGRKVEFELVMESRGPAAENIWICE